MAATFTARPYISDTRADQIFQLHLIQEKPVLVQIDYNEQLRTLIQKQATLPQDKIFALRSIFTRSFGKISVDYDGDPVTVFAQAAQALISEHNDLRIFTYSCSRNKRPGCPSWVPEWAFYDSIYDSIYDLFSGGISTCATRFYSRSSRVATFSLDGRKIRLRGRVIGCVGENISVALPEQPKVLNNSSEAFDLNITETLRACTMVKDYLSRWKSLKGIDYYDHFVDALAKASFQPKDYATEWLADPPTHLEPPALSTIKPLRSTPRDQRVLLFFAILTSGMSLLLDSENRLGIARDVLKGDTIALLQGAHVPYILRPTPDDHSYTLVSPAFVNGAMQGELWPFPTGGPARDDKRILALVLV